MLPLIRIDRRVERVRYESPSGPPPGLVRPQIQDRLPAGQCHHVDTNKPGCGQLAFSCCLVALAVVEFARHCVLCRGP